MAWIWMNGGRYRVDRVRGGWEYETERSREARGLVELPGVGQVFIGASHSQAFGTTKTRAQAMNMVRASLTP